MATDPNIQLSVRPSPIESGARRVLSLREAIDSSRVRQLQMSNEQLRQDEAKLDIENKKKVAQSQQVWGDTIRSNTKFENGKVVFDDAAIKGGFIKAGMPELATKFEQDQSALRKTARDTFLEELDVARTQAVEIDRLASGVTDEGTYQAFRRQAMGVNPQMPLPPTYNDEAKSVIGQIREEAKSIKLSSLTALQQVDYQDKLTRLPENQASEVERKVKLYREKFGKEPDQFLQDLIFMDAAGLPALSRPQTPKKLGQTSGANLPPDARDRDGELISDRSKSALYNEFAIGNGESYYVRQDAKQTAARDRREMAVEAAMVANPKLTEGTARQMVLRHEYESNRLSLLNQTELAEGRAMSNQEKRDFLDGKLSSARALQLLNRIAVDAARLASAEIQAGLEDDSPYFGKSLPQIENSLLSEYGFSRKELTDAIGTKKAAPESAPPATKPATRPPISSFEKK